MKIECYLLPQLCDAISPGKVVVLYEPRQVGKTTLVTELLANTELKTQLINAHELRYREALGSQDRQVLGKLFGYEFKQQGEMRKATRREFSQAYPNAELQTITMDNFEAFLRT